MPYIKKEDRKRLVGCQCMLALYPDEGPNTAGELNFTLTMIIHNYLLRKGLNYQNINEVMGVLECAKQELYRQVAASYEDKKKEENGPVSNLDTLEKT